MPTQALNQIRYIWILIKTFEVCAQPLTDIRSNQWLITGETKTWSDIFEVINHIFWNPQADSRHGATFFQALFQLIDFHTILFLISGLVEQR